MERKQIHTFFIGFALFFTLSLSWPIALFGELRNACANGMEEAWRWLRHEQTFSTIHLIFFPAAFGAFLASIDLNKLRSFSWRNYALLGACVAATTALSVDGFARRSLQPYELGGHECCALEFETTLRSGTLEPEADVNEPCKSRIEPTIGKRALKPGADVKAVYQSLLAVHGIRAKARHANTVAWASGILTWLFMTFVGITIWYAVTLVFRRALEPPDHIAIVAVTLLMLPWVPARVYADYYQSHFFKTDWYGAAATFALIVSVLVLGFHALSAALDYWRKEHRDVLIKVGGLICSFVAFVLAVVPKWTSFVEARLQSLSNTMLVVLLLVGPGLALVLGAAAFRGRITNEKTRGAVPP